MLIKENGPCLEIQPQEDMLLTNATTMQQAFSKALETFQGKQVKLDLTKINNVDSTGLKLIIGLFRTCQTNHQQFYIETSSSAIVKLMQLCGLNKMIEVKEVLPNG